MNIAFPALVLTVLIFPGIAFRRGRFGRSPYRAKVSLADEIGLSIVAAIVLHAIWFFICELLAGLTGLRVSLSSLVVLLSGHAGSGATSFENAVSSLANHPLPVFVYFVTLLTFGQISGIAIRYIRHHTKAISEKSCRWLHSNVPKCMIPSSGADRSILHLSDSLDLGDDYSQDSGDRRFGQWLRSFELDEDQANQLGNHFVFVIAAAVVELGGKPFLFRGTLDKAFFSSEGELERLTLKDVCRRAIDPEERDEATGDLSSARPVEDRDEIAATKSRYYSIDGDTFILRMNEVKTINFLFGAFLPPADEPEEADDAKSVSGCY